MIVQELLDEYQHLLNKISGVKSSKIIKGTDDIITEIHLLADTSRGPKQIVRDVQSALLAKYSLAIDHKIVSIAQIHDANVYPKDIRLVLSNIQLSTAIGRIEAKVVLARDEQLFEGTASGGNSSKGRYRVIVEATLNAVHHFLNHQYVFALSDATRIILGDRHAAAVSIFHLNDGYEDCLSGSSMIKNDENEAVVRATLDAVNRRLIQYYMK